MNFKRIVILVLMLFGISSCGRDMDYIIENEPYVVGIVKEIYENSILIECEPTDAYPSGAQYDVSLLNIECGDSVTHFNTGDEVVVYYNGEAAETYPMQINTVYAITLRTPVQHGE